MPTASRSDHLSSDATQGALRDARDGRIAVLSLDSVHALHLALIEQFADNAADVLYRSGYEWALQDMVRFHTLLRQGEGDRSDRWPADAPSLLDTWWAARAGSGWGRGRFDCSALARGISFVELQASAVAPAFAGSDQPVCHLYAGLFAGALSFFERSERHATEIQCSACGAASCLFVIGPGADVDAAETWRQQGIATSEIARRLR